MSYCNNLALKLNTVFFKLENLFWILFTSSLMTSGVFLTNVNMIGPQNTVNNGFGFFQKKRICTYQT